MKKEPRCNLVCLWHLLRWCNGSSFWRSMSCDQVTLGARVLFCGLLGISFCTPTNAEARGTSLIRLPLGIADQRSGSAYIRDGAAIKAIALDSGQVLWTYLGGFLPLSVEDGKLTILAGSTQHNSVGVAVVVINAMTGIAFSSPKSLVVPQSQARYLFGFSSLADVYTMGDHILIKMPNAYVYSGGANPPAFVHGALSQGFSWLQIDPASGDVKVEPFLGTEAIHSASRLNPERIDLADVSRFSWTYDLEVLRLSQTLRGGKAFLAVSSFLDGRLKAFIPICPVDVLEFGPAITSDGAYIFFRVRPTAGSMASDLVFSSESMSLVVKLTGIADDSNTAVVGEDAFALVAGTGAGVTSIVAVSLPKNEIKWRFALSPLASRGAPRLP